MLKKIIKIVTVLLSVLFAFTACNPKSGIPNPTSTLKQSVATVAATASPTPVPATATPVPRVLSICMGQEPSSLFLYADSSVAAQNIRQAIYDGPFDLHGFDYQPVIIQQKPSMENGDVKLEPVQVKPGDLIIDNDGKWANLAEGVNYRPSGCTSRSCAKPFSGTDPAQMDSLVVRFQIVPDVRWSDGAPLTADDSVYSYEIARALYPAYRPDFINVTWSYQAVNANTVEWRGFPGYQSGLYASFFFSPLPRHAWQQIKPADLAASSIASKTPLGWGPYQIEEWTAGDHISLRKNPNYYRAAEGLPHFDRLVFRFMPDANSAVNAIKAGECDLADETVQLQTDLTLPDQLKGSENISLTVQTDAGWEQAAFGIQSIDPKRPALFAMKETRQAVAECIDRQQILSKVAVGQSQVTDSFVSPQAPLVNSQVKHYDFDPQKASDLLNSVGWLDPDNDPTTPRVSQGIQGVPDGTPFQFSYLVPEDAERQQVAGIVAQSLGQCGIKVDVVVKPWNELMASGPDGMVFGRQFDMAEFGWESSLAPACMLFATSEIPGPYPDFPKGWGGANAMGYSSADLDQACFAETTSLPGTDEYKNTALKVQEIIAEDVPVIPLYFHTHILASRPDLCGLSLDSSTASSLWNLEKFDYGGDCSQ